MPEKPGLPVYVLYNDTTKDYPGEWVVRLHRVAAGVTAELDPALTARGSTKEECLASLFEKHPEVGSMIYLHRLEDDDPVIEGTFI